MDYNKKNLRVAMEKKIDDKEKLSLVNKLKEIRETFGMSRNVFAREAKIDVTLYTRVEEGTILPDYLFLKQLIHTYRISPYFLFDFQEVQEVDVSRLEKQRTFSRFTVQLKAKYSLKEGGGVWEECTILDFSRKGMAIELNSQISLGSTIHLAIHIPEESELLSVKGVLKWIKKSGNLFMGGIELTEIFDENKTLIILRAGR
jgi:transcriptional regulator with XRE-family HTH domain